jgi:alanine racemase
MSATLTVDLAAIRENYRLLARRAAVPLIAMIKADAYGLGATAVASTLAPERPVAFGVATVAEGVALREAGVATDMLVFTPAPLAVLPAARSAGLTLALDDPATVAAWTGLGGQWHLAIDTGMSRAGVDWRDTPGLTALLAAGTPDGVFTHFHSAESDPDATAEQERRFAAVLARFASRPRWVHAENSAALLQRGPSRYDCARPGIALYGVAPGPARERPLPVVTLHGTVVSLRTLEAGDSVSYGATWRAAERRRIATVALGYADGYPRGAGQSRLASINGHAVPIVGHVTMDMLMCDVSTVPAALGDIVTVIHGDGDASVGALARKVHRSPYEILTGLRSRSDRRYRTEQGDVMSVAA